VTVASVGEILQRFRFHGVPGAPAPAGVPVDRASEIEAELAPVFSFLEAAQHRAEEMLEDATAEAARRLAESAAHARRILAQARLDADAAREDSAAEHLARAEQQRSALVAQARSEAERIARVAPERTPGLVEELVRRVLCLGQGVPQT